MEDDVLERVKCALGLRKGDRCSKEGHSDVGPSRCHRLQKHHS